MKIDRTVVLVGVEGDDPDADPFRQSLSEPDLAERIEVRFGRSSLTPSQMADVEVVVCANLSPELVAAAPKLRWISFWSAGLDGKVTPQIAGLPLIVTNASGVHGPPIAEHVLAMMLMFTRGMPRHLRSQGERRWGSSGVGGTAADELTGKTLGIVGLGRIGEALAVRAKAFDMRVIGIKRHPESRYGTAGVDAIFGVESIPEVLSQSDHVCIALPYTEQTHHLFNAQMLANAKPGAFLYNIARGKLVDEVALIACLKSGSLSGAGLDVFETEPLPADSPLWGMENVIITPHSAGDTPYYFTRAASLFANNLRRYLGGESLQNRFNPELGY